eukprot:1850246-Lingulodinium_polyedra.AAC.1
MAGALPPNEDGSGRGAVAPANGDAGLLSLSMACTADGARLLPVRDAGTCFGPVTSASSMRVP